MRERKEGEREIRVRCDTSDLPDILAADESKHCECSRATTTGAGGKAKFRIVEGGAFEALRASGGHKWVKCAGQWHTCTCPGYVRWGNAGRWMHFAPKASAPEAIVPCRVDMLPDVALGDNGKHCECLVNTTPAFVARAGWRPRYVGCYSDAPEASSERAMPKFAGRGTLEDCTASCLGYKYFGHQSDLQCWCGNSYDRFGASHTCRCGDASDLGAGANCVYKIEREATKANKTKAKVVQ